MLDKLGSPCTWNIEVEVFTLAARRTRRKRRGSTPAGGDLFIRELTGGMGIGILSAGGDAGFTRRAAC